tara:strand:- start:58 stop:324 length:267 start_codon:yes stop_codon:yes gene_type:complete
VVEASATNWLIDGKAERSNLRVMTIKVIAVMMVMIEADFSKLTDEYKSSVWGGLLHQMIEQRGLTAAREVGQHRDWQTPLRIICCPIF